MIIYPCQKVPIPEDVEYWGNSINLSNTDQDTEGVSRPQGQQAFPLERLSPMSLGPSTGLSLKHSLRIWYMAAQPEDQRWRGTIPNPSTAREVGPCQRGGRKLRRIRAENTG